MTEGPRRSRPRAVPLRADVPRPHDDGGAPGLAGVEGLLGVLARAGAVGVRRADGPPRVLDGLRIYEGALSLFTTICCVYRDSPYKREGGRDNDRRPSSKPASILKVTQYSQATRTSKGQALLAGPRGVAGGGRPASAAAC